MQAVGVGLARVHAQHTLAHARCSTPASTSYELPAAPTVAHRAGRSARPHRGQCAIAHILARDSQSQPLSDDDLERLKARLNAQLAAGGGPSAAAKAEQAAALATVATVPSSHQPDNCFQWNQSLGWNPQPHHLSKADLWQAIRQEAKADADAEPALASFLYSTVLVHANLEKTLAFVLANKLASATLLGTQLMALFNQAYDERPDIIDACCADVQAVYDRDPACDKYTQALLYFKGFQAVQCHRIAHWLWQRGRRAMALAIQSRVSEVFHVDIHPAASLGRGLLIDHATGVVIGETATVGDNVSMLHHVTLGGSGTGGGKRHPTVGHGVLLGAGVTVLGPVMVGCGSKVGAGSVVVTDLPTHCVAVGVPARIIKRDVVSEPCEDMDQQNDFVLDFVI